jgi:hypothetical protein
MSRAAFAQRLAWVEQQVLRPTVQTPDAIGLLRLSGLEPDAWQSEVLTSQASRLAILCARQTGKSSVCAALALSTALHEPQSLTLLLSPSLRQSQELFQKVLSLYRLIAAQVPAEAESAMRITFRNCARILSLPGTEETIRGYSGVRLLIVDEAARVEDILYYSIRPMVAVSKIKLLCI